MYKYIYKQMTSTKILIEKNVSNESVGRGAPSKYRFEEMEVGNSFEYGKYSRKKSQSLYGCIYNYLKKDGNKDKKFKCQRTKDNKIKVWREA